MSEIEKLLPVGQPRLVVPLLPCPFCGGVAAVERIGTPRASSVVSCEDCGCRLESNENGAGYFWNLRNHKPMVRLYNQGYHAGHHDTAEGGYVDIFTCDMDTYHAEVVAEILQENDKDLARRAQDSE